ncbi:MAG: hemerythrin domain-containing protein, partial [Actinoallomurus sp.]
MQQQVRGWPFANSKTKRRAMRTASRAPLARLIIAAWEALTRTARRLRAPSGKRRCAQRARRTRAMPGWMMPAETSTTKLLAGGVGLLAAALGVAGWAVARSKGRWSKEPWTEQWDVIEVLTHDHREVEEMFRELSDATDANERRRITDDITIELVRHSVAEESYLYPAVREHVPGGGRLADKEIADHAEIEQILKQLEEADVSDAAFSGLLRRLVEAVRAHIEDEESNLFPKLAAHVTRQELIRLGQK